MSSKAQEKALEILRSEGFVYAGYHVTKKGSRFYVHASALRALERRGMVSVQTSPDGGLMARPVDGARNAR